jgi:hypothetical protein
MRIEIIMKGFWKPRYGIQIRCNGGNVILESKKGCDTLAEIDAIIAHLKANIKTAKVINMSLLLED